MSTITLHSSWRGVLSSLVGASVVFLVGALSTSLTGGAVGSLVLLGLGLVLLMIVLFDFPVAAEFDADGVVRRPLLRRHRISWSDVDQLTRARPGIAAAARNLKPGGLVAKIGRRRYLLVDQCESRDEHDLLVQVLAASSEQLWLDDLVLPPEDVDPTWTYRRRRWQPSAPNG